MTPTGDCMNEEFNELLEQVGEELEEYEENALERIQETIDNIANIIRFLDAKIITFLKYDFNSRGKLQIETEYFEEPGILIYGLSDDVPSEIPFKEKIQEFDRNEDIPKEKIIKRRGKEVYLLRDTRLIEFTREEVISPQNLEEQYIKLENPEEIELDDILKRYPDFDDRFFGCFKQVILRTIQKNPKKRGILQKIIEFINEREKENH